jgi:hypothetical protein
MNRIIKIFPFLLVLLFSTPAFVQDYEAGSEPNCNPKYKEKAGEIELLVEDLEKEVHNPKHEAVCLYIARQNSVLLRTKTYESFTVIVEPGEGAPADPFYRKAEELLSVNGLLSTGPPRLELSKQFPNRWLMYKVTINYKDKNGKPGTIDPHWPVRP